MEKTNRKTRWAISVLLVVLWSRVVVAEDIIYVDVTLRGQWNNQILPGGQ